MVAYYKNCEITDRTAATIEGFRSAIADAVAAGKTAHSDAMAKLDVAIETVQAQLDSIHDNMADNGIEEEPCNPCSPIACNEQLLLSGIAKFGSKLFLVEGNNFERLRVAIQAVGVDGLLEAAYSGTEVIVGYAEQITTSTRCGSTTSWKRLAADAKYSAVLDSYPNATLFVIWTSTKVSVYASSKLRALGVPDDLLATVLARRSTATVQSFQIENAGMLHDLLALGITADEIEEAAELDIPGIKLSTTYPEVQGRLQQAANVGVYVNECGNVQFSNIFSCAMSIDQDKAFDITSGLQQCMGEFFEAINKFLDLNQNPELASIFAFFDEMNNSVQEVVDYTKKIYNEMLSKLNMVSNLESIIWGLIGKAASAAGEDWVAGFGTSLLQCLLDLAASGEVVELGLPSAQGKLLDEILNANVFAYFDIALNAIDEAVEFIEDIFDLLTVPMCIATSTITKIIGFNMGPLSCIATFDLNVLDMPALDCITAMLKRVVQYIVDLMNAIRQLIQNIRLFIALIRAFLFDIDLEFNGHNLCNPAAANAMVGGIQALLGV